MHTTGTVHLACTDCHGGKADVEAPPAREPGSASVREAKKQAHPQPKHSASCGAASANPVRPYADWLKESKEYIQFVNPGDLRVADRDLRIASATRRKCAPYAPA